MADLVFDVGMHDGEDTAYYLSLGYDVVAIDANPAKCATAEQRFASEITCGRLQILNVGIAEAASELEFWVSEESEWSSFDRSAATRQGRQASAVLVPLATFAEILDRYREPLFIKVDIEGNDKLCLRDIAQKSSRPKYISFEGDKSAAENIALLSKIGYEHFKCVRQNDHSEMTPRNIRWQVEMRKLVWRAQHGSRIHYRRRRFGGHPFPEGSSGPMPWIFPGPWLSTDQLHAVWGRLEEVDRELRCDGLGEWFDIHASKPSI